MGFSGFYALLVGVLMIGMWLFLILSGQVPNLGSDLPSLLFHWAAELGTAILLIAGGWALLGRKLWSAWLYPLAMGALLYTLVNSAGYYVQRNQWGMVLMFGLLFALALLSLFFYVGRLRIPKPPTTTA